MRELRTIRLVGVRGKRVLVRADADVDLDEAGRMEPGGDHRLRGCLPTLQLLREQGARIILIAHVGRPRGTVVEKLRTAQVGKRLAELLDVPVRTLSVTSGPEAQQAASALRDGDLLLLENVRFDPREEQNDREFAGELAALGDLYVNEAFADSHRAHASVLGIPAFLPSYAGLLFAKEVQALETVLRYPARPVVAAISGAKLETKIPLLRNLLPKVDQLLTGGGVANMFLRAQGHSVGASLVEPHLEEEVRDLRGTFGEKIFVPTDVRVSRQRGGTGAVVVPARAIGSADIIYDVGPETIPQYCLLVSRAKTCVWNGPLGKVELPDFREGTKAFAECVRAAAAYSVVGGGDTVTALRQMHLTEGFDHVSSGGGAMLAFLEGATLPAVEALRA